MLSFPKVTTFTLTFEILSKCNDMPIKVLLINTNDSNGGAAIACRRLMDALSKEGVDVKMLVLDKVTGDTRITPLVSTFAGRMRRRIAFLGERLQIFLQNRFSRARLFTVSTASLGFDISDHPLVREADVIHLHWVNHGFLSLSGIDRLLRLGKPVVWTMHDLWEATGICHYPGNCRRFTEACGACPLLDSTRPDDLSARVLQHKRRIIPQAQIRFVGCSEWLTGQARQSVLALGNSYHTIPNPIDLNRFAPGSREEARRLLGLPIDKKLILFGAANAADKRKGIDYLTEATLLLANRADEIELVMCGKFKQPADNRFGLKVHEMGFISDPGKMITLYRAADLFVTPSLEDNLPNMIMEAMACGIPCVGFATGGIPEMITHRLNGYLAQYCNAADLAEGIVQVLQMPEAGAEARRFAETHYAPHVVARRYLSVYNDLPEQD
ncbi:MAG: glycosyltransferase family 4 protein [Bacteroidales bacterium]